MALGSVIVFVIHFSGEAIVAGNQQAVKSLLEVFEWLFEYILEKIGSEASSDVGGEGTHFIIYTLYALSMSVRLVHGVHCGNNKML